MENERKDKMFRITFTKDGNATLVWDGYVSYAACLQAIRDADACIPLSWDYTIDRV